MIDYALAGRAGVLPLLFSESKSSGATEWLFPDLVEQRRRNELCGAIVQSQAKRGKSNEITEIVSDLFEIGGTASWRVVAVLAGRLHGDLPLTSDGLYVGVAQKLHGHCDLLGAWRKEIVR
jgi:hypothetical protein